MCIINVFKYFNRVLDDSKDNLNVKTGEIIMHN